MKTKLFSINSQNLSFVFALAIMIASAGKMRGQTEVTNTNKSIDDEIVSSIQGFHENQYIGNIYNLFHEDEIHRQKMVDDLIKIFNDPSSGKRTKGYAAYYLGVLHATKAVDSLANQINFAVGEAGSISEMDSPWISLPAVNALLTIGSPSIPALIRNLAESDDDNVRKRSLRVLNLIEGDKDIVQLRLQKALNAEKDSNKQARLQAALKSLAESSF
jgi:hypothetical protein